MTVVHAITYRKIRFALVGCGRIAQNHFGSLQQHAEAAAAKTGAQAFTSLDTLLADHSGRAADIVVLTTPAACTRSRPSASPAAAAMCSARSRWRRSGTRAWRWCASAGTRA